MRVKIVHALLQDSKHQLVTYEQIQLSVRMEMWGVRQTWDRRTAGHLASREQLVWARMRHRPRRMDAAPLGIPDTRVQEDMSDAY